MYHRVTAMIFSLDLSLFFLSIFVADSPHARSTVVTAVKFTIADQPQAIDALLKGCIGRLVRTAVGAGNLRCQASLAAQGFFTPM